MSRSTKKPYFTDQNRGKPNRSRLAKSVANDKVKSRVKRAIDDESLDIADGKAYRKVGETWDIRDWSFHAPKDKKAYRK